MTASIVWNRSKRRMSSSSDASFARPGLLLILLVVYGPHIITSGFVYPTGAFSPFRQQAVSAGTSNSALANIRQQRMNGWYPDQVLVNVDAERIAFDELYIEKSTDLVVYLPNLAEGRASSDLCDEVKEHCIRKERNFISADWFGRGGSSGKLMNATLTRWTADVITILDTVPTHVTGTLDFRKAILVGNGVGVWVAVLVALERPDLVRAILGVSADPDFTEDLLWKYMPEEMEKVMQEGFREIQWGTKNELYPMTSTFLDDAKQNLVLRQGPNSLPLGCPVRLIHSLRDEEVPPMTSIRLAHCIDSPDIQIDMPKFSKMKGVNRFLDDLFRVTPMAYDQRYDAA